MDPTPPGARGLGDGEPGAGQRAGGAGGPADGDAEGFPRQFAERARGDLGEQRSQPCLGECHRAGHRGSRRGGDDHGDERREERHGSDHCHGTDAEALLDNIPSGTSWTAPVTLQAYSGETVTLRPTTGSSVLHFQNGQSYIVIDGLILDGANVGSDAVKITYGSDPTTAAHHIRISNGEIKNAPVQGVLVTGPNTRFNEFINLKIHGNGGAVGSNNLNHGIYIEGPNNLVDNCDFYGNAAHGVQSYSSNGWADNNTIRNTKSHGNNKGMVIASGSGNVAYNNLIYGNPAEGLTVDYGVSNAAIYNNTFYNNGTGIYI